MTPFCSERRSQIVAERLNRIRETLILGVVPFQNEKGGNFLYLSVYTMSLDGTFCFSYGLDNKRLIAACTSCEVSATLIAWLMGAPVGPSRYGSRDSSRVAGIVYRSFFCNIQQFVAQVSSLRGRYPSNSLGWMQNSVRCRRRFS